MRIKKLQKELIKNNIDLVLFYNKEDTPNSNMMYFSNYPGIGYLIITKKKSFLFILKYEKNKLKNKKIKLYFSEKRKYLIDQVKEKLSNFNIKNAKEMVKFADRYDAVCLGNGITRKADKFCQYFIKKSAKLKVVDADALKSMSFKDFHNSILTPHEHE